MFVGARGTETLPRDEDLHRAHRVILTLWITAGGG
eukprot:SAG31_NODE_2282_length_6017_cov_16.322237_8_plen_35_part_00